MAGRGSTWICLSGWWFSLFKDLYPLWNGSLAGNMNNLNHQRTIHYSKGNFGSPSKGTLVVVPQILPHISLYSTTIIWSIYTYRWYMLVCILGALPRVPNSSLWTIGWWSVNSSHKLLLLKAMGMMGDPTEQWTKKDPELYRVTPFIADEILPSSVGIIS